VDGQIEGLTPAVAVVSGLPQLERR
jgi:hypothetical protein